MTRLILSIFFVVYFTTSCTNFSRKSADKPVYLSKSDLALYDGFKSNLLTDLKLLDSLHGNWYGDMFITHTNSYYLYQIDKQRYEPIVSELKRRGIYIDAIEIANSRTIHFRLKEVVNDSHLPHICYGHSLIFDSPEEYSPPYSIHEVLKDSVISPKWRYIYSVSQVGH